MSKGEISTKFPERRTQLSTKEAAGATSIHLFEMVINEAKSHQIYTYPEDSQNSVKQWSHSYKLPFLEVLSKRGTQSDQKIKELIRELTLLAEKLINDSNPQKENLIWSLQSLPSEILSYFKSVIQIAKPLLAKMLAARCLALKLLKNCTHNAGFSKGVSRS
ncbi:unnamed protein product, partial [Mesorhabditis belari]|uniref:Uncharacterized protein n=1 Tax=Mesorhabditis belari TaxID=2138241 RepID=A0AAF3EA40_9BILA